MPTKTKTAATLPARIESLTAEMRAEALANWRRWAEAIAAGHDAPAAREVLEAAQILKIDAPAATLQADADALAELKRYEAAQDLCRRTVAEKLEPWGGRVEKLRAAAVAAKAEADRLAGELDQIEGGCSMSHWTVAAHALKKQHPTLWPELQPVRPVADDAVILEDEGCTSRPQTSNPVRPRRPQSPEPRPTFAPRSTAPA